MMERKGNKAYCPVWQRWASGCAKKKEKKKRKKKPFRQIPFQSIPGEHSGLKSGMDCPWNGKFGSILCQISFLRNPQESAGMTGFQKESVGQGKDLR